MWCSCNLFILKSIFKGGGLDKSQAHRRASIEDRGLQTPVDLCERFCTGERRHHHHQVTPSYDGGVSWTRAVPPWLLRGN